MSVTSSNDPIVDEGTNSYTAAPRPEYTSETGEPTNSVEKVGNITYDATADQSEGVDNVRDERERTVSVWPDDAAPEKASKKK